MILACGSRGTLGALSLSLGGRGYLSTFEGVAGILAKL